MQLAFAVVAACQRLKSQNTVIAEMVPGTSPKEPNNFVAITLLKLIEFVAIESSDSEFGSLEQLKSLQHTILFDKNSRREPPRGMRKYCRKAIEIVT